jgi:hypothetical protein
MTRYLARPPGSTYEHPDAPVWPIVKFLCWIAVSAVVIHFGLGFVSALMIDQAMEVGERPYLPSVTQDEQRLLESDGWINKDAGSVHIPIEDAMRLTVESRLASRTFEDGPAVGTPGSMPSDSSGGRLPERRTP